MVGILFEHKLDMHDLICNTRGSPKCLIIPYYVNVNDECLADADPLLGALFWVAVGRIAPGTRLRSHTGPLSGLCLGLASPSSTSRGHDHVFAALLSSA